MLIAPQWISSSDPKLDVGFVVLNPHDGENIQRILHGNHLDIESRYHYLVRVTGYPASGGAPVTCVNRTHRQSQPSCDSVAAGIRSAPAAARGSQTSTRGRGPAPSSG